MNLTSGISLQESHSRNLQGSHSKNLTPRISLGGSRSRNLTPGTYDLSFFMDVRVEVTNATTLATRGGKRWHSLSYYSLKMTVVV